MITEADLRSGNHPADTVALGAFPIDVHETRGTATRLERMGEPDHHYAIPLGALVPKDLIMRRSRAAAFQPRIPRSAPCESCRRRWQPARPRALPRLWRRSGTLRCMRSRSLRWTPNCWARGRFSRRPAPPLNSPRPGEPSREVRTASRQCPGLRCCCCGAARDPGRSLSRAAPRAMSGPGCFGG